MRGRLFRFGAACTLALAVAASVAADTRIEKVFRLGPGGRLVLDSSAGAVSVTGGTSGDARIVITSRRDDLESVVDFDFEEEPGLVRITARKTGSGRSLWRLFTGGGGIDVRYEIEVPDRTDLEVKTAGGSLKVESLRGEAVLDTSGGAIRVGALDGRLDAHTSGGSIEIREIGGDARVDTSGGSIRAYEVAGSLRADTSGGSVTIEGVAGDVEAESSGGPIRISAAGGRVEAETSGGSIRVAFAPGNGRGGFLETSGGGITVALDPGVDLDLDARTSGGSVRTDLPVRMVGTASRASLKGRLGSGGEKLTLRTSGGSINIEPL